MAYELVAKHGLVTRDDIWFENDLTKKSFVLANSQSSGCVLDTYHTDDSSFILQRLDTRSFISYIPITASLKGTASYTNLAENSVNAGAALYADVSGISYTANTSSWASSSINSLWATNSFQAYNVKYFGAIGNDSADDRPAIQLAIDAAFSSSFVKNVFIPKGTYRISAPINMLSQVKLFGAGKTETTIRQISANANGIMWKSGSVLQNVEIRNLTINGPGSGSTTGTGIWIGVDTGSAYTGYGGQFQNVSVINFYKGVNIRHWITSTWDQCDIQYNHIAVCIQKADSTIFQHCRIGYSAHAGSTGFLYETASLGFHILGGEHGNCGVWFNGVANSSLATVVGGNYESFYGSEAVVLNGAWRFTMINPRMGRHSGNTANTFTVFRLNNGAGANSNFVGGIYEGWDSDVAIFTLNNSADRLNYVGVNALVKNTGLGTAWTAGRVANVGDYVTNFTSGSNTLSIGNINNNIGFHGNLYGTASWANVANITTQSLSSISSSFASSSLSSSYPWQVSSSILLTSHNGNVQFGMGMNLINGFINGTTYTYDYFSNPTFDSVYCQETSANIGGCASSIITLSTSKKYIVECDVSNIVGTAPNIRWVIDQGGRSGIVGLNATATNGFNSHVFTPTSTGGALEFSVGVGNNTSFTASNIKLKEVGLVFSTDGKLGVGVSSPINTLDINGNISCSIITASLLLGTSSFAVSSSRAITASYALSGISSGTSLTTGSTYPITSSVAINANTASVSLTSDIVDETGTPNTFRLLFVDNIGNQILKADENFTFTPDISVLSCGQFSGDLIGNANTATSASYAITASYAHNGGSGGTSLTTGSTYPITSSCANWAKTASVSDKINVTDNSAEFGTYYLTMVDGYGESKTLFSGTDISVTPENGTVIANTFDGNLDGNASTATNAVNAQTASIANTSSWANTSSFARTASFLPVNTYNITSSWANNAKTGSSFSLPSGSGNWNIYVEMSSGDLVFKFI